MKQKFYDLKFILLELNSGSRFYTNFKSEIPPFGCFLAPISLSPLLLVALLRSGLESILAWLS